MRMTDQAYNRLSVLKKLRAAEPVSRTELAQLTGLNGGTITGIVRDLVERGLVVEQRVSSAQRGRPRVNLRIAADGAFVVGATMTESGKLVADVVDLRGRRIWSHSRARLATSSPAELARHFAGTITEAILASPVPRERITQIGIGLPAIVDSRAGIVAFLETFEGLPFAFAEAVEQELHIPTRIDNNFNLVARSEHWFGAGSGIDDFTLVILDLGLGAARYQGGQLLMGSHGIEAEFGHTKIVPEGGRPCHCGAQGCLQTYSSLSAVVYQACELAGERPPGHLDLRARFVELAERAKSGDPALREILDRAGRYLGRGIANHINMQDPDRIVVLTKNPELIDLIAPSMFEALHRDTLPVFRNLERVTFRKIEEASFARGAAAMVLEQIYIAP